MPEPPKAEKGPPKDPEALIAFMLEGWSPPTADLPPPHPHHETFRARRRALSAHFPGETLVVPTGALKVRSNDTHHPFRPGSDFYYLTGSLEPESTLVLVPEAGGGHRDLLFVEPRSHRSDPSFFTDRERGALWVGSRFGVPETCARFGVHECRPRGELREFLSAFAEGAEASWCVLRGLAPEVDAALPKQERDAHLSATLGEMRLVKDALEIGEVRAAINATRRGFEDVIRRLPKTTNEREVEAIFRHRARVDGNDTGYHTIAAAGPHGCILHYTHNNGALVQDHLLLLDAGVEGTSLYTADITRTLPISGRFTSEQREIYTLVYKAQRAAMAKVQPGLDFMAPNRAAMAVLAEGLEQLGILTTTAATALEEQHQFYRRYSLHNVSHMLGLDVHDCASARAQTYRLGKLKPGMVLTIEPGLYFQPDDLTVPERYRGIGVRIEDDVVVTENGCENLSARIPAQIDEVEAWMARLWKRKKR